MEKFIATLFMLCAVGLGIASLATTHWQDIDTKGVHAHYGLFQSCKSLDLSMIGFGEMVLCANNLEFKLLEEIWKHERK